MVSRQLAKRARQHLLSVLYHAQVTVFSVDNQRNITLLEGAFIWDLDASEYGEGDDSMSNRSSIEQYIGKNVYEVLGAHDKGSRFNGIPASLQPIEDVLNGKTLEKVCCKSTVAQIRSLCASLEFEIVTHSDHRSTSMI